MTEVAVKDRPLMRLFVGVLLLAATAYAGPISGTVDGVTYNLQNNEVGNGYVDYIYEFSAPVSAYSMNIVWYGAPTDYHIVTTYGGVTQQSTGNGILYATLSGAVANSPAAVQYNTKAMTWLSLEFESRSKTSLNYPYLEFTNLVDPPASSGIASVTTTPEPKTLILTGLGLFALDLCRRWLNRRNIPASI